MDADRVDPEIRCAAPTTRRAALSVGGKLAAAIALVVAGLRQTPADAKKGKKHNNNHNHKKKKCKPACGDCAKCVNGKCKSKPNGTTCAGGTCRQGACNTGGTPPPPPQQILTFNANPMTPGNQVPPPGQVGSTADPGGLGSAMFTIQGNRICSVWTYSSTTPANILGTLAETHIHAGMAGANGPVVVNFVPAVLNQQVCTTCPSTNCADPNTLASIIRNPDAFYANIHYTNFDGAVRAQLTPDLT